MPGWWFMFSITIFITKADISLKQNRCEGVLIFKLFFILRVKCIFIVVPWTHNGRKNDKD